MPVLLFQTSGLQLFSHHGSLFGWIPRLDLSGAGGARDCGSSGEPPRTSSVFTAPGSTPITMSMRARMAKPGSLHKGGRLSRLKDRENWPGRPDCLGSRPLLAAFFRVSQFPGATPLSQHGGLAGVQVTPVGGGSRGSGSDKILVSL